MPAAITTLRTTLANTLTNAGVWSTFAYPAPQLLANSVTITPSDPYITPSNNSQINISPMANFDILIAVPAFDNKGNLAGMETFIVAVFNKLYSGSLVYNVSSISAPSITTAASGDLLICKLTLNILTSWS